MCIWSIGFRVLYETPFLKSNLTNIRIDFLSSICLPCVQDRKNMSPFALSGKIFDYEWMNVHVRNTQLRRWIECPESVILLPL